ncbi:hypothetical protein EZS27_043203, partial [termite gut metagenome]
VINSTVGISEKNSSTDWLRLPLLILLISNRKFTIGRYADNHIILYYVSNNPTQLFHYIRAENVHLVLTFTTMNKKKIIIYQVFTRLFGNTNTACLCGGSITENGCGKMSDFTVGALREIKKLGITHIWYTGIIEHATQTDYTAYGIAPDHPAIVKGKAGSPYAIKDYYDVDPDLANDVPKRMKEFENLV